MAYTTIDKSSLHFNTKLYTGNGSAGHAITGVGHQPDLVWMKGRNQAFDQCWYDSVRGVTKLIRSNTTNVEVTQSGVTAFDSDGFTLGSSGETNSNNDTYVSWNWKANGAGSANTDGDINSTVSANTTSGVSIVNYTGTLSSAGNPTIGHGLGVAPEVIITKSLSNAENWGVQATSLPANYILQLNTSSAQINSASQGTLTAPTSSVFTVNYLGEWGNSGQNYIAYVFAPIKGFSKFGVYDGNGNADGTFVYTGFKPGWIMLKQSSHAGNDWWMFDSKRLGYNPDNYLLRANISNAELTNDDIDLVSNGFKIRSTDGGINTSGNQYFYMAFAEAPLVGSNNVPANARW